MDHVKERVPSGAPLFAFAKKTCVFNERVTYIFERGIIMANVIGLIICVIGYVALSAE